MNTKTPNPNAVQAEAPVAFYAKAQKIYPREVEGRFARLRVLAVWMLLGLYYVVPWLRWGGHQAVLFDLPARKFYIFGLTLWPQDFIFLSLLLIIAALSLFFFTALAGRLWCGFACPQTVWTEAFIWIERLVEGRRNQRIKLDKAPWTTRKYMIKGSKHALWLIFALITGITFVGYFTPILELVVSLVAFDLGPWETFWVFFYGFATYGNAGWMREQVCIYMCPYARFQSAMFDNNTLIISYDAERGETRGSRRRGADYRAEGKGDCIDCKACVQVCPTGIDIRDGLQYQCIACAACVDVCDDVMDKMDYPRGLIRYTTENALKHTNSKVFRPRTIVYACVLTLLMVGLGVGIATRTPLRLDVIRDRNALYRETNQGLVENVYTLKVINMAEADRRFSLEVDGLDGAELILDVPEVAVGAGEVLNLPARVRIDPEDLKTASSEVLFKIEVADRPDISVVESARFIGPSGG